MGLFKKNRLIKKEKLSEDLSFLLFKYTDDTFK